MRGGRAARVPVLLAGMLALAGACDSGRDRDLPDPGPSSGLDPTTPLLGLDTATETSLCEWIAGRLGGYGHLVTCGNGAYVSSLPLQQCIDSYQMVDGSCTATVGTVESCINDAVAGCASWPPGCLALIACTPTPPAAALIGK